MVSVVIKCVFFSLIFSRLLMFTCGKMCMISKFFVCFLFVLSKKIAFPFAAWRGYGQVVSVSCGVMIPPDGHAFRISCSIFLSCVDLLPFVANVRIDSANLSFISIINTIGLCSLFFSSDHACAGAMHSWMFLHEVLSSNSWRCKTLNLYLFKLATWMSNSKCLMPILSCVSIDSCVYLWSL